MSQQQPRGQNGQPEQGWTGRGACAANSTASAIASGRRIIPASSVYRPQVK